MIEDLEKLKKEYLATEVPSYLATGGWTDLYQKLGVQKTSAWHLIFVRGLVFASLVLLLSGGIIGVSQAAKPGDFLFPLKSFSDNVIAKVTNNPTYALKNRAKDVINQSGTGTNVGPAVTEYQKILQETKDDAQKTGQTQEFKKTLEEQTQQFRDAQKSDGDKQQLQKAIDEAQKINGEVQGVKDFRNPEDSHGGQNNQTQSPLNLQHEGD